MWKTLDDDDDNEGEEYVECFPIFNLLAQTHIHYRWVIYLHKDILQQNETKRRRKQKRKWKELAFSLSLVFLQQIKTPLFAVLYLKTLLSEYMFQF